MAGGCPPACNETSRLSTRCHAGLSAQQCGVVTCTPTPCPRLCPLLPACLPLPCSQYAFAHSTPQPRYSVRSAGQREYKEGLMVRRAWRDWAELALAATTAALPSVLDPGRLLQPTQPPLHPLFPPQKKHVQLPWWTVEVAFKGRVMGSGASFDKRDAGQAAAREALQRLGQLPAGA